MASFGVSRPSTQGVGAVHTGVTHER